MTAHSLQQELPQEVQGIWDKRDKYDIIILIDNNTSDYYYSGSKLELLRSFIVDVSCNHVLYHIKLFICICFVFTFQHTINCISNYKNNYWSNSLVPVGYII